jgi:hypothetical protein
VQRAPVRLAQHHAAARGDHADLGLHDRGDDLLLEVAEGLLAPRVEEAADRTSDAALDFVVDVNEGNIEPARQMAPDGRFAAAGQADQGDTLQLRLR